jgi:hypothetical protein
MNPRFTKIVQIYLKNKYKSRIDFIVDNNRSEIL